MADYEDREALDHLFETVRDAPPSVRGVILVNMLVTSAHADLIGTHAVEADDVTLTLCQSEPEEGARWLAAASIQLRLSGEEASRQALLGYRITDTGPQLEAWTESESGAGTAALLHTLDLDENWVADLPGVSSMMQKAIGYLILAS